MLKSRRFWLGAVVSLGFLALFLLWIDFGDVVRSLREASYVYILPAIVAYFLATLFRTVRWQYLLSPVRSISASRLFPVVAVGYMANNLLPFRLGELVRVYYLGEKEPVSKTSALATVALERGFDGLILVFFVAVVSLALPVVGLSRGLAESGELALLLLALLAAVLFVIAVALLWLMAKAPLRTMALARALLRFLPGYVQARLLDLVEMFVAGLAILREPRRLPGIFLLSLPVWLLEALLFFLIGISFDLSSFFSSWGELAAAVLLATAFANLALIVPSVQGGVGPFEAAITALLVLLNVSREVAVSYALVVHITLLVPVTLLGLLYLWADNLSLAQLSRRGGSEEAPAHYGVVEPSSRGGEKG